MLYRTKVHSTDRNNSQLLVLASLDVLYRLTTTEEALHARSPPEPPLPVDSSGSASFSNLFGLRLRRRLWRLCSGCRPRRRGRVRVRLRRRIGIPVRDVAGGFFSVHLTSSECFSSVADPFCVRMPLASSSTTARAITATTSTDLIRTVRDLAALWQLLRSARQDQPPARRRST